MYCYLGFDQVLSPHTSTIKRFLEKGLAKTTVSSYSKSSEKWVVFLRLNGFVTDTSHPLNKWAQLSFSQQLRVVVTYIMWLHSDAKWSASKISANISGVRDYIRGHLLSLAAFDHESVSLALKATQPDSRELSLTREARKRLPVTIDMLTWFKTRYWKVGRVVSRVDFDNRMVFLGLVIGLIFMRRVSEYAYDTRTRHAILAEDVHFISRHNPPKILSSVEIKRASISVSTIETVRFIFRTSKTDQGGRGAYRFLSARNVDECDLIYCLWQWCLIAGLESKCPFFSRMYEGRRKVLRSNMVNLALKHIADNFGLNHVRNAFTSHSLRIGGATALIANGSNRETVQRIGGWSTTNAASDSIYELNTPREDSNLWSALRSSSSSNVVSLKDIQSIIPPHRQRNKLVRTSNNTR